MTSWLSSDSISTKSWMGNLGLDLDIFNIFLNKNVDENLQQGYNKLTPSENTVG